ncbi:hypothetical protein M885DRAFT_550707 [Pelagophyceae sp. CCMP2097]|nr:hypothetical protein M885DRAFT_550707 [Pelagophyceae sp. CCMP2097]
MHRQARIHLHPGPPPPRRKVCRAPEVHNVKRRRPVPSRCRVARGSRPRQLGRVGDGRGAPARNSRRLPARGGPRKGPNACSSRALRCHFAPAQGAFATRKKRAGWPCGSKAR